MTWIQTYSGRRFFPLDPRPADVKIEDIAHALSNKCRFNGHCLTFYSVAEHSVRVATLAMSRHGGAEKSTIGLQALLHDAAEAYLPDICSPIKRQVFIRDETLNAHVPFSEHEVIVLERIVSGLGLPPFVSGRSNSVAHADLAMLATEARDIMSDPPEDWTAELPPPIPERIVPWSSIDAECKFMTMFRQLMLARKSSATAVETGL